MNTLLTDSYPIEAWQGRQDIEEGVKGNRWHQQVAAYQRQRSEAPVLLGYACEAGVIRNKGRAGAKEGPVTARKNLANLPALEGVTLFDAGDIDCRDDALEHTQQNYAHAVAGIIDDGNLLLGVGGDHSITYATFQGLLQSDCAYDEARYGIINFDAHLDNRCSKPRNSGTSFYNLMEVCQKRELDFKYACIGLSAYANTRALIERAEQDGALLIYDTACIPSRLTELAAQLETFIASRDLVYLTIDMDCLPAATMPAVSAPAAMGIDYWLLEQLTTRIVKNPKIRVVDIAEFSPVFDLDGRSAKVTGRLLAALIHACAIQEASR
ncbi:formimidoylglutamase [Halomonas sp. PR-M31]|uniref:formimidoylglutamase n=1 Tax=Halomonas sp. PR-M31 TaxID=1471202 RepID=UPI00069EC5ED|nr:formimidoylglutamase [Halomonas sp. PR-M31]